MSKVTRTETVNAPAEKVWEIISDYGNVHIFHPLVRTASILSKNSRGVGAIRRCEFYDSSSVVERVTRWDEGYSFTVELTEMSTPLKRATATMLVSPINEQSSNASVEMDFEPKFGLVGRLMGAVMIKPMMKQMFSNVLKGLAHYAITGDAIGKGGASKERIA